jgi:hypothetical protein
MKEEKAPLQHMLPFELKILKSALLIGVYRFGVQKELCEDYLSELQRLCQTYG